MSFKQEGKLIYKGEIETKGESFSVREFAIETDGQYPQKIKFQIVQDRCSIIDPFEIGQNLDVYFDLRGREWEGKYFTNLNAWKVDAVTGAAVAQESFDATKEPTSPAKTNFETPGVAEGAMPQGDLDDLPF